MESKASQSQTALKKPRSSSEPRPSCPPFKVPSFFMEENIMPHHFMNSLKVT
jgi:hypothetical protein